MGRCLFLASRWQRVLLCTWYVFSDRFSKAPIIPERSIPPSNLEWKHLGNSGATHAYVPALQFGSTLWNGSATPMALLYSSTRHENHPFIPGRLHNSRSRSPVGLSNILEEEKLVSDAV